MFFHFYVCILILLLDASILVHVFACISVHVHDYPCVNIYHNPIICMFMCVYMELDPLSLKQDPNTAICDVHNIKS